MRRRGSSGSGSGSGSGSNKICFGQLAYVGVFGTTLQASKSGVGTVNSAMNDYLLVESQKWYFMWIVTYLLSMVALKTAVCVTLLRILPRTQQGMRIAVWALLSLVWLAWAIDFLAVLFLCRPIKASWDSSLVAQGKAECGAQEVLIIISHLLTAASVVTDIGCTVLPGIMLWRTQIHRTSKLEVFALLSIASIASIATIIRAPYFTHYSNPADNLSYWCGHMVLYSNIETGIGLFASALPALRRFYRLHFRSGGDPSSGRSDGSKSGGHQLATFGGTNAGPHKMASLSRRDRHNHDGISASTAATANHQGYGSKGDWERLTDEDSDKGILINAEAPGSDFRKNGKSQIRVDHTFEVASHNA